MSIFIATISWKRNDQDFLANKYSRAHRWQFDGGTEIQASASPHIVPLPWSVAENVDPEEAFVASLSSCHMLFFLDFAKQAGFQVDSYEDNAQGKMGKNSRGSNSITRVILKPVTEFSGANLPTRDEIAHIHHQAHQQCFIANSVTTEITLQLD